MMGDIKQLSTRLQTADNEDIKAILDLKLDQVGPNGLVDYIGLSVENIEVDISRVNAAIAELQEIKKSCSNQINIIKEVGAEWLSCAGIDSLKGDRISSVSILNKKPKEDVIIEDEVSLVDSGYFKTVVDKTSVKNAILAGEDVVGARIEVTHIQPALKINKKRTNHQEDELS